MAPELQTKQQLATAARTLAASYRLVQRKTTTYIPADWETFDPDPPPAPERTIWLPLHRDQKQELAMVKNNILFYTDAELRSLDFMIRQLARPDNAPVDGVLVRSPLGLRLLNEDGALVEPTGDFVPNVVMPPLSEDPDDKAFVFQTISDWVGGEEAAHSLLHHLATVLSPNWSVVKYVLLLGEGRNGKSLLLSMLADVVGDENISNVTRQMMAERNPTCVELNNKLVNIVYDGEMAYIKDSSMEKTLIAGETGVVRMLYESGTTKVQTCALFIEALNLEPKVRDKSSALQKRLVRFNFGNVYALDRAFERKMRSEKMLGAFLALLIEHYVREPEIAAKLAPVASSLELQMEQVWLGSPVLQFIEHVLQGDPQFGEKLEKGKVTVESFMASFKPWLETQGQHERSDGDILTMLKSSFEIGWKSIRENNSVSSKRTIKRLKPETVAALEEIKKGVSIDGTDDLEEAVVD